MNSFFQDIRYSIRQLRKSPGFTLTAVLTLALGIGATTAIFSIVEGVLLRPLPFADPSRLVVLGDMLGDTGSNNFGTSVTAPEVLIYARDTHAFQSLGGYQQTSYELSGLGEPAQVNASRLTAGVFPTLGVSPIMGRVFTQQEDVGSQQVVVISYQMWRSRFNNDEHILGQKILLDRKPYEIIGVMPREFEFPLIPGQLNRSELWVPMSFTSSAIKDEIASWNYNMVGRLKSGVALQQAEQDMQRVSAQIMQGFPPAMAGLKIHAQVDPLAETTIASSRPVVRTLFFAVVVVLFIACANLAGLLLVRVIRRRREISVRLAVGAGTWNILRQSLMEALLLSVCGGLIGLALASTALRVGKNFLPETLPRVSSIGLDWKVITFALLLAILTGIVCGFIPALTAVRTSVNDALKEGGRTGTGGSRHARLRSAFVIAELAVALVLLTASGLLLRSFEKMRTVDVGFRTEHLLTASYSLPHQQYSTQAAVDTFNSALLARLSLLPGVQAVGITPALPLSGSSSTNAFYPEGYVAPKGAGMSSSWSSTVLGKYFSAIGIKIIRGRDFTTGDNGTSPLVIIVNRKLAEHYWPGQDPIGKRIHMGLAETPLPWMTVVGEIADIKQTSADTDVREQIYYPASQFKPAAGEFFPPEMLIDNNASIVIRSSLAPEQMISSLTAVVRSIDPQLPLTQVESMEKVVSDGQAPRRFNTVIISAFAAAAVLLSLIGIYSVIAFSAAMRTQEMAIRLALGAQRVSVLRLVLVSGAWLGLIGCGVGAVVAFFATRLMRSMLFEVDPLDPTVITLAALSIFVLALVASLVPAHRAASIEPMQALRTE